MSGSVQDAVPRRSVLLVDDHRMFTDLLAEALNMQDDLRCVGAAHSVDHALDRAAVTPFDVAIVDVELPGGGLSAIGPLLGLRPEAVVVVLTAYPRPDLAQRALDAGAAAFLGKEGTLPDILAAVRRAGSGQPVVCAAAAEAEDGPRLTHRERDVLRELGNGLTANEVAGALGMSLHTARHHIKSIMAKFDVSSQLAAVVAADRMGLIDVGRRY